MATDNNTLEAKNGDSCHSCKNRRTILSLMASGLTCIVSSYAFGSSLLTPSQMLGPFYPKKIPLEHDNDLTTVSGNYGISAGEISHLIGQVLTPNGSPVIGAKIEIWQCDAFGQYKHPGGGGGQDPNFQGYGRTRSGVDGQYRFKTIKPVTYPGRTPHIHMRIVSKNANLTTQLYVKGERLNDRDFILNAIRNTRARSSLIIPFVHEPGFPPNELVARFDPVVAG